MARQRCTHQTLTISTHSSIPAEFATFFNDDISLLNMDVCLFHGLWMFRMCIITVTALKQMIPLFSVDLSSFVPSLNQSNFSEISPAAWESQGLQYLLRCTLCWWRDPCCLSFRKLDIPDMSSSSDDSLCTFYKTLTHSLRLSHRCSLSWLTCL